MMEFTKEQMATFATFAWREGQKWAIMDAHANRPLREEIHLGSLQYLAEKVGANKNALDLHNQRIEKQLESIM
jgi:hypothetical protein